MRFDLFIVLALATWRISYMLVSEAGPGHIFEKLRTLKLGGVMDCIFCTSVWVGFIAVFLWLIGAAGVLYPFALSGLAMMLRGYTGVGYEP
jgi:hypothetical protein